MPRLSIFEPGFSITSDLVVVAPLKQGGMGAVFVVEQRSTGKRRALKVMHREIVANASLQRRFEQEARVGAHIESDHVVEVLGAGVESTTGLPYILMELLEGVDLGDYCETHGALRRERVRAIFEQLCHGVGAAHAAGIVHRDLKPENVFLASSRRATGERFMVKVLDFGIAKLAAESTTATTTGAVGSPMWMAPEQTSPGPVTPATDVWALGLIAYRLFTGSNFWRGANAQGATTAQLLREIVLDPIPLASERASEQGAAERLPRGFDAWFARAVAREPEARFADASELWKGLSELFAPDEALAKTEVELGGSIPPVASLAATEAATPFDAPRVESGAGASAPPPRDVLQGTPIAAAAPSRASDAPAHRALVIGAVAIGIGGMGVGWALARGGRKSLPTHAAVETSAKPAPSASASPAPLASSAAEPPPSSVASAPAPSASAPVPLPALATRRSSRAHAPHAAPTRVSARTAAHKPGVTWTVGNQRHVRLLAYLVSNRSNVADATVRKAVEWDSWQYLRCYEPLAGLKQLPAGTVTIGFDILDMLPQHARVQSSTIKSASFDECVLRTLLGQTINAAGPDGKGHVVYAFRFVPQD